MEDLGADAVVIEDAMIREEMAALLRKRGCSVRGDDPAVCDPGARRVSYPAERPVRCD